MITQRSSISWLHGTIYLRQKSRWWRDIREDCDSPYKMPLACTRCGPFLRPIRVHLSQRSSRISGQWSEAIKAIARFGPKNSIMSSRQSRVILTLILNALDVVNRDIGRLIAGNLPTRRIRTSYLRKTW
jgi:hypothetical protein